MYTETKVETEKENMKFYSETKRYMEFHSEADISMGKMFRNVVLEVELT